MRSYIIFARNALTEQAIVAKASRINEQINERQVRLINGDGGQLGVLTIEEALAKAREQELDLVEVAPQASPVVCKLMDYGRFSYQEKKKRNETRNKQRSMLTKMVKFRPNTFKGDYEVKRTKILRFLEQGDKVKVVMQFRGREIIHAKNGYQLFQQLIDGLIDNCVVDARPSSEGRFINMTLAPLPARIREQRAKENAALSNEDLASNSNLSKT